MIGSINMENMNKVLKEVAEKLGYYDITAKYGGSGWEGGIRITFRKKERGYGPGFSINRFPLNCNLMIVSNIHGAQEKLAVLDEILHLFGHSGVLISDSGWNESNYKAIEDFGFIPLFTDFGIQHGGTHPTVLYYKPINQDRKVERGGETWEQPKIGESPLKYLEH